MIGPRVFNLYNFKESGFLKNTKKTWTFFTLTAKKNLNQPSKNMFLTQINAKLNAQKFDVTSF